MIDSLRRPLKPFTDFIAKFFKWMHPTTISIVGFMIGFVPVYFFARGEAQLGGLAMVLYSFDFIDGSVARMTNRSSIFGELLDASLDRVTDGLIIFSIAYGGIVSWPLAAFVLMSSYMVSYIRGRAGQASAKQVKLTAGIAHRAERIILITLSAVLFTEAIEIPVLDITANLVEIVFAFIGAISLYTVFVLFIQAEKLLKTVEADPHVNV